ncbi:MAG: hypothetical protein F4Z40_00725 [Chloroflexi bacterium]|nr:hypothetical protein [Chloroflexota bacterium]
MSDGPWKSLPLRNHWKQVAKRAEKSAFSSTETSEHLEFAIRKEAAELPIRTLVRSLVPNGQMALIEPDIDAVVNRLMQSHPGSKIVQTLAGHLELGHARGLANPDTLETALAQTLEEHARDNARAIEEHYFRKSRSPSVPVGVRLELARRNCDYEGMAKEMIARSDASDVIAHPRQRSGIDEGPSL